ncbi:N-acetylmuramoyl-L-alanine amidase LytC [Acaryochloris thomasi RCC1774]|uniref:N-acetylmuramoyl-L-alanine amidase LytC n=1 Tax=Acaryochloris thomasi RCC1774 TaxID=1764569 RepID=A0A2W1JH78_9CYAN|nr:N-acetylmuramoyl-L-alanine amidase LytC [Acaryochloris thomasi RCC1774]
MPVKIAWIALVALGVVSGADAAWAGKLTYWRFNSQQSRVDLITDTGTKPKAVVIHNPTRLIIDLPNTSIRKKKRQKRISEYVKEVRVAQFSKWTTRVVVELDKDYSLRADQVKVRGLAPNRWYVQLPKFLAIRDLNRKALITRSVTVPQPKLPQPTVSAGGSSAPIAVKPGAKVVLIDPGHGGRDPGAVGRGGLQEKRVVLPVSLRVVEELRRRGVNAQLTRSSDQTVDLAPRVRKAEGLNADIFVSIHANAISLSRPEINGLETFYYQTGSRLASNIHRSILQSVNVKDRRIRQARFYVLRKTSMPAVLVELGYVTGSTDAPRLATKAHQDQLAVAIANGVINYIQGR